jgi:hypothetical protein
VLHYTELEGLDWDKHSSLLGLFVSYDGKKCCEYGPWMHNFIFFVTYNLTQYARVLDYTKLEVLARDKYSSLLVMFIGYNENEVL